MCNTFIQLEQRKRKLWRMEWKVAAVEKAAARYGDLGGVEECERSYAAW